MNSGVTRFTLVLALHIAGAAAATAQTAENIAIVINENSAASKRIGEYYIKQRDIPESNVIRIRTTDQETIDRSVYNTGIEGPIAAALARERLQDRVLYIVLTKGVPLRVQGSGGDDGTGVSVDSELTLLYRRMTGAFTPTRGRVDNPYFLETREITEARRFSRRDYDIYLVTRLDAFTVDEAVGLVDKAKAATTEGRVVLDQRAALLNRVGEDWLDLTAKRLSANGHGDRVMLETTVKPARDISPVLGYYSWGSADPQNRVRAVKMGFAPGALAGMLVSFDARTFVEPPPGWMPTDVINDRSKWYVGAPASLSGDLIREGATGVAGYVAEQYIQSTVRPQILFPAYLAGFNLAESFYLATPHLSWQGVIVGDPLCAPFRRESLTRQEIDEGIDSETELPAFFSRRRLAQAKTTAKGIPERALVLALRSEGLAVKGDMNGVREALEEATKLAPQMTALQLQLATQYEQARQYDEAIERYRTVLEFEPRSVMALNNLAYAIAVHKKNPTEGLPLARQAAELAKEAPVIADTLAWIEHLLGNHADASKRMAQVVKGAPGNAELRLHAAIIYAAAGQTEAAERELQEALRLDPRLEKSEDVTKLRARLGAPKP